MARASGGSSTLGSVFPFAGSIAPNVAGSEEWHLCDGSELSRTTYSNLFGEIGTTYGVGDGSTTFNIPDYRGVFPLGVAASGVGSTLGGTGGTLDHTHTISGTHVHGSAGGHGHSESHQHPVGNSDHTHGAASHQHSSGGTTHFHTQDDTDDSGSHNHGSTNQGGSHSHATGPATLYSNIVVNFDTSGVAINSASHHSDDVHSTPTDGGHTHSTSQYSSTHSHTNPNTDSGGSSHQHDSQDHSHTVSKSHQHPPESHAHDFVEDHQHAAAGDGDTGASNPPFLVLNYAMRIK